MPRPCKECPFRRDFAGKYPETGVFLFVSSVLEDGDNMQCHMTEADRRCVGCGEFLAGGNERTHGNLVELAQARSDGSLVPEFFRQLERLTK